MHAHAHARECAQAHAQDARRTRALRQHAPKQTRLLAMAHAHAWDRALTRFHASQHSSAFSFIAQKIVAR
eukprot:3933517-Pleurochrysis_carterae.AAC.2